jgi:hypothetical protein
VPVDAASTRDRTPGDTSGGADASDDARSDIELAHAVATTLTRPRVDAADSFVLHAPLELLARTALLPMVRPDQRDAARRRIAGIAQQFEAFGPGVGAPVPDPVAIADGPAAARRLHDAIEAGDLDAVDAVAAWLGRHADPHEQQVLLTDEIVPRLSAAAHCPIHLYQLPRVVARGELPGGMLRPLAREVGREPAWRLSWMDGLAARQPDGRPGALFEAIASTPRLGIPGSDFIFPIMSQVEGDGRAAELLGDPVAHAPLEAGARELLRAAGLSMVHEPPDFAPYGWSHCLTMPQAVLGLALGGATATPTRALAVAATFVAGFRAALAHRDLPPSFEPDTPGLDLPTALAAGPREAAAAVWHHPHDRQPELIAELVTRAAVHPDAHLVKYTLACLDAAAWDQSHARLYLAAAGHLHGYWSSRGGDGA